MTENEIEINKAFIKKGIDMSLIGAENLIRVLYPTKFVISLIIKN